MAIWSRLVRVLHCDPVNGLFDDELAVDVNGCVNVCGECSVMSRAFPPLTSVLFLGTGCHVTLTRVKT